MFGVRVESYWQGQLAEYVSAIAWAPDGQSIALGDASGAVWLLDVATLNLLPLQLTSGQSNDCLAFSADQQFLAAAGQDGSVKIWRLHPQPELLTVLAYPGTWIDHLAWHPHQPQLVFQAGFDLHIWEAVGQTSKTLPIAATAQAMQWHPQGDLLTIAVKNQLRTWETTRWQEQSPIALPAPATAIAWSVDGQYLALGTLDRQLFVWEWGNPDPWRMQGFPGKVSQLAWSATSQLAVTSLESVIVWERSGPGWANRVLALHEGKVTAIGFQPGAAQSPLLASVAQDAAVVLWEGAQSVGALLEGAAGFSGLAWQPQGRYLAVGGVAGEILVYSGLTTSDWSI